MKAKEWAFDSLEVVLVALWEVDTTSPIYLPDIDLGAAAAIGADTSVRVVGRCLPPLDVGLESTVLA